MIEYYDYEEILLALEEPADGERYESQYDLLWKGILESTFWHFLTFMFPKVPLDWGRNCEVEFLDKELQQLLPGVNGRKGVRHVDKILDQEESKLRENPNPFAVVVLTALLALKNRKADDEQLLSIKRDLYKQMITRDMSEGCMRGVYDFLARYVHFDNQENMFKFEDQLKKDFGGDTTMGIAELLLEDATERGVAKGKAEAEMKYSLQMRNAIIMLQNAGVSIMEICKNLDLKKSQVEQLLKND